MPFKKKLTICADRPFHIKWWRTAVQAVSLVLLNPFLYRQMNICLPVMNCWACPAAATACPVGVIGGFLAHGIIPFAVLAIFVLSAVVAGRIFCGWVCPFGFLQDLLYMIPTPKYLIPRALDRKLFVLPLLFFVATVVVVPIFLGKSSLWFFCSFCPAGTLEAGIPLHIANNGDAGFASIVADMAGSWRVWILVTVLVSAVVIRRSFCRLMCPIGLTVGIFNFLSHFKVPHGWARMSSVFGFGPKHGGLCPTPGCGLCTDDCPTDLNALADANGKECIYCYQCIESCPPQGTVRILEERQRAHPFLKEQEKAEVDLAGRESGTFLRKDLAPHESSDSVKRNDEEGEKQTIDLDP